MNYCTKCGTKIENNNKFCTKCGAKIQTKNKENRNQNLILMLGVFLVLFASFVLGIISWKNMGSVLRISFFGFECALFFLLSLVLKKLTESKFYRVFFIIGLVMVPYILTLVPYYELLPTFLNEGAGLYIYLAIIYAFSCLIYIIINNKFKSVVVDYLSLILLLISFLSITKIFNSNLSINCLVILCYSILLNIISYTNMFNDKFRKVLSITSKIVYLIISLFITAAFFNKDVLSIIVNSVLLVIYIVNGYIIIYKNEKSFIQYFIPFIYTLLSFTYVIVLLSDYENICLYSLSIITLLFYLISFLSNRKVFNLITLILTYISLFIILMVSIFVDNHLTMLILSIILLLYNVFVSLVNKYKFANYALPFIIFILIVSIFRLFIDLKVIYILLTTSFVYLVIYTILKIKKNNLSITYLVGSLVLAIVSLYNIFEDFNICNILILVLLSIIFILTYIFKEEIALSVITFVFMNFATISIFKAIDNALYYGLLTISGITLISSILLSKFRKINLKPYIIYSEIVIFIITLFNSMNYKSYILFINIFIFALSYLSILKYNNNKWWRIANVLVGLLTIIRIINTLISVSVIASIISIFAILIIIVIMYLLDVEGKVELAILSLIILYPYYTLIGNYSHYLYELYIVPLIVYDIVFTEVIDFKNEDNKKLATIIPLSILCFHILVMNSGIGSIIFDVILSLLYIILGLYRKYNYLIYLGIIFMIVSIIFRLFTVLNSTLVVVILIVIGFILIGIAIFNETRKKK